MWKHNISYIKNVSYTKTTNKGSIIVLSIIFDVEDSEVIVTLNFQ